MPSRRTILLRILPLLFGVYGVWYWLFYKQYPVSFVIYLFLLPSVFAASVVTLAGRFRLWSWSESLLTRIAVWSGYGGAFFAILGELIVGSITMSDIFVLGFSGGIVWGAIATLFDVFAMDDGIITVFNRSYYKKLGTIKSVGSYGPYFFGAYGVLAALLAKFGHWAIIEDGAQKLTDLQSIVVGCVGLSVPFVFYILYLRMLKKRSELRRSSSKNA